MKMTTISGESHNLKGSSVSECEPDSPRSRDSGFDNLSNESDRQEDSSIIQHQLMKSETPTKMQTQSSKLYEDLDGVSETETLHSLQSILKMFFDNRINEAERLVEKHETSCVNHSHVKMFFTTMSAMLTLDPVSCLCFCLLSLFTSSFAAGIDGKRKETGSETYGFLRKTSAKKS